MSNTSRKLTAHESRLVAVNACVDPRTIEMYFDGRARSTTAARIEQTLQQLGRSDLIRERNAEAHAF